MRAPICADVAKLVDAPDLGSDAARRVGSSPTIRTTILRHSSAYPDLSGFLLPAALFGLIRLIAGYLLADFHLARRF